MVASRITVSFVGATIGPILIEDRIGMGGMGEVYRGFHQRLERRVAVKTIRPDHRLSGEVKARFLREARLLSKLGHPGICQVYDLIETPDADFLVLEYVEGRTLKEIAKDKPGFERRLRIAEQIAIALAAAHRERIVHRDLKSDNVMVTPRGEVKVLDFGIARSVSESGSQPALDITPPRGSRIPDSTQASDLTQIGDLIGTAKVMSPEQARGGRVTIASDLYSLGILLQELFTGEPAYGATHPVAILEQVMRAETRPLTGLDPDLTRLIEDLQNLDARRRPSADATAERLRWILDKPQRLRRRRLVAAGVVTVITALVAVLGVVSWLALQAWHDRSDAERLLGRVRTHFETIPEAERTDEERQILEEIRSQDKMRP
jgi:serine/threonine-protein kinase